MAKKLAKLLVGKREKGEIGYYKKLAYIEDKLREFIVGIVAVIIVVIIMAIMFINAADTGNGKYVPDGYDIHGNLIDTDGDGDYHHWVEE